MTNVTINDTLIKSVVVGGDFIPIWDNAESVQKKASLSSIAESIGIPHIGFMSGRYYLPHFALDTLSNYTLGNISNLAVVPYFTPRVFGVQEIVTNVVTNGTVGSVFRLGIYKMSSVGQFTSLLAQGELSSATTGAKNLVLPGSGLLLDPGWYGLALHVSGSVTFTGHTTAQNNFLFGNALAQNSLTANTGSLFLGTRAYGSLPSSYSFTPNTMGGNACPAIWLRAQ